MRIAAATALIAVSVLASAQQIDLGERKIPGKNHVTLLSDSVEVVAEKPQDVELRFRVDDGYHINSHSPLDELLIPTVLKIDGPKVIAENYPSGSNFRLSVGDGQILSVYQGEFRVALRVVAAKGQSNLNGVLRYQACDSSACFPPRNLVVKVAVTGK